MEVQVNVAQDEGEKLTGEYKGKRWRGFTDSKTVWKSFRIPWNAYKEPNYKDSNLAFSLADHAEGIGLTGWNWEERKSYFFGYDFDSIVNHKEGLNDEELEDVYNRIKAIPYATLQYSTSGRGFHVYIHLDKPVDTANHTEHAAIARSILSVLSLDAGYNFANAIDVCGMVLWVYHRKSKGTRGLSLTQRGELFDHTRIPTNWKHQINVTSGRRKKVAYGDEENEKLFNIMAMSTKQHELDTFHREVLNWFKVHTGDNKDSWWDNDYNMLVCHTHDLKRCHTELNLRGFFETSSSGSSSQNCYAFPGDNGSWVIRRHNPGVTENPSWVVDPSGWTRCLFNVKGDLETFVRAFGGMENARGDFVFRTVSDGLKVLDAMDIQEIGRDLRSEPLYETLLADRQMTFKQKTEGRLILQFERQKGSKAEPELTAFVASPNGKLWEKVITIPRRKKDFQSPDHLIRHAISFQSEVGWFIQTRKQWVMQPRKNVETVLAAQQGNMNKHDVESVMSKSILDPWEIVNVPFAGEYPGNRQWNKEAAAFSCIPEEGACDTWMNILEHCGKDLDMAIAGNTWCQQHGVTEGKEYLLLWVASMFQKPTEPLPYLFLVGPQNSGKSTFHEAISILLKSGYAKADGALVDQRGFNKQISKAVFCVVEEIDLGRNQMALNRIKEWVTAKYISIHIKLVDIYDIVNTTHWLQCANDPNYCPVFPNDTRIVVINVNKLDSDIPKHKLLDELEKEKRAFLHLCLTTKLPPPPGRLGLPVLKTGRKKEMELINRTPLEQFMEEVCYERKGALIGFSEFYDSFYKFLEPDDKMIWSKKRTARQFPKLGLICKGKQGSMNKTMCGNLTFDANLKEEEEWFCASDGRLRQVKK